MNETMLAAVITEYGAPEVLRIEERPRPIAREGEVVVRVRAFGVNHAESYFRRGVWGDVARISGIECVGEVWSAPGSDLREGQRVFALMGGMGRSIDGSYAQFVRVPRANVVAIRSDLAWTDLAAIPESYATAWTFLHHNLALKAGQTLVVRGGTSALGQAAIDVARDLDVRVFATSRSRERLGLVERLGATPLVDDGELAREVRARFPNGVDAVLDVVGTSTLHDSLKLPRYRGRVAIAGFLGGGGPAVIDPLMHMPSGVQLSFFASAFVFGSADLPLSTIPFQGFVDRFAAGAYRGRPAHVLSLDEIVAAHRLMESGDAKGKIVVRVD